MSHVCLVGDYYYQAARTAVSDITFPATFSGHHTVKASMDCDQLTDIHHWTKLKVS